MASRNTFQNDSPKVMVEPLSNENKPSVKRSFVAEAGFTLVELAVAVAIIGILAAGAAAYYMKSMTEKARTAVAQQTSASLRSAASVYTGKTLNEPTRFSEFVQCGGAVPSGFMAINLDEKWQCHLSGGHGGAGDPNAYDSLILTGLGKLSNLIIRYTFNNGNISYTLQ